MTHQLIATTVADLVEVHNDQSTTTSLTVAQFFGKQHRDVMRSIDRLDYSPEFNARNFARIDYVDSRGRSHAAYRMTRDGFTFLMMSFTGPQAAKLKETYIARFNEMEQSLRSQEAGAFLRVQKELAQVQRRLIATQRALIAAGRRELKLLRAARPLPPAADGQLGLGL